jgi:hypothetical protein
MELKEPFDAVGKLFLKNRKCLAKYLSKLFCLSGFT